MADEKMVRLRIVSRMRDDAGAVNEMKNARHGTLACTADGFVLEYDDENEGERAHIVLTFAPGRASMQRRGMVSALLTFEPGRRAASTYVTMYGEIPVAVDTRRVDVTGDGHGGRLTLDYDVYMGGERTSSALLEVMWRA